MMEAQHCPKRFVITTPDGRKVYYSAGNAAFFLEKLMTKGNLGDRITIELEADDVSK